VIIAQELADVVMKRYPLRLAEQELKTLRHQVGKESELLLPAPQRGLRKLHRPAEKKQVLMKEGRVDRFPLLLDSQREMG
jgi:hypothetical protein